MTLSSPPAQPDPPRARPSWAAVAIVIILGFAALVYARDFLMPVTFGLLLFFVFAVPCRALARLGVPDAASAAIVSLALLGGLGAAVTTLAVPIASAVENAPRIVHALKEKLSTLEGSLETLRAAVQQVREMTASPPTGTTTVVDSGSPGLGLLAGVATTTPTLIGQIVFVLVLLFFALASRRLLYRRTVDSFAYFEDKQAALATIDDIEKSLGIYLGSITLINALLGTAIGLAMWGWGMPSPELFGAAAFATNYVPYVGPIAGTILATLVALVSLDGVLAPLLVGGTYLALISLEGQFITPYFLSRRLRLNPVIVFVTVALFAWMWSVIGMVVAVPMLVVLNVVCAHVPGMEGLGNFLAGAQEGPSAAEEAPAAPPAEEAVADSGPAQDVASESDEP